MIFKFVQCIKILSANRKNIERNKNTEKNSQKNIAKY